MEINEMTLVDIEERLANLSADVETMTDVESIESATNEKRALLERKAELAEIEKRKADAKALEQGAVSAKTIEKVEMKGNTNMFDRNSIDYRDAFLAMLVGKATPEQRAIFADNTNYGDGIALPATIDSGVWDQACSTHKILSDINIVRSGIVMKVPQITPTVPGAKKDSASSSELTYTTAEVVLAGHDFHTFIKLSYAEACMSMNALEKYLINEIATVLGEALAKDVFATILSDAGTAPVTKSSSNTWLTCLKTALGSASLANDPIIYAPASLYYEVVGEVDTVGQPVFRNGLVLNAKFVLDNAATKVTVVDPKQFLLNVAQDVMVESQKDVANACYIIGGYCRAQGCMRVKKAASYIG